MNIMEILDREGLRIASNERRILAFVIDDIIISLVVFMAFFDQMSALGESPEALYNLLANIFPYIALLKVVYQSIFTAMYGASIGKIICKIKIVRLDILDKPSVLQSISRSMLRVAEESLLYIPLIFAFADTYRRAFHDIILQTIVIDVSIPQEVEEI